MLKALPLEEPAQPSANDIYHQLHAEIISCAIAPGTQFRERQIAERFNVSKSPVRDALIKLQAQNLVQVMPRKGYCVTPISLTDARDLYEMRTLLEREAIVRLIETGTDQALDGLDAFRSGPMNELGAWIAYNRAFHVYLAEHCGNQRLAKAGRETVDQFDRLTRVSVSTSLMPNPLGPDILKARTAEHCAIIDAIQARDKRKASTLSRQHIEKSRKRLLTALESTSITL